ncbi:hypothetical protein BC938DRAFT_479281 [Jimgerdemannia flammicorona]|uniref:Zn(2)-C6 fungal-type domain-containing protein n=1 Tax=Jimgerdemannia flammicorona TaxID=994334 RepID=A0A433QL86_9FUNG|nr:hypothetical protein BC938DRAFT_479281 [Jimgerdemannia flammicorona]
MDLNYPTLDPSFRRRSNPCESCRRNRRKCVPNSPDIDEPCLRCQRMKLQCVYEPSKEKEKPKEPQEDEDVVEERAQMVDDVAELQRQLASFEREVVALRTVPDFPALEVVARLGPAFDGVEMDTPGSPWSSNSTFSQLTTDDELSSPTTDAGVSTPATILSTPASILSTPATTFSDDASGVTTVSRPTRRQLRPCYLLEPGAEDPDLQAEREMFKRLFYFLSSVGTKFQFLHDHGTLYILDSSSMHVRVLGPPKPLPGEVGQAARAVSFFAYTIELGNYQFVDDLTDMQYIYAGLTDKLSVESCSRVETSLIRWYNDLPATYRVTPNIFQYLSPEELARADPYTLSLTLCFYICWLSLHAHFLPPLEPNDLDAFATESDAAKLSLRSLTICAVQVEGHQARSHGEEEFEEEHGNYQGDHMEGAWKQRTRDTVFYEYGGDLGDVVGQVWDPVLN